MLIATLGHIELEEPFHCFIIQEGSEFARDLTPELARIGPGALDMCGRTDAHDRRTQSFGDMAEGLRNIHRCCDLLLFDRRVSDRLGTAGRGTKVNDECADWRPYA
jgi:hypothetical protein